MVGKVPNLEPQSSGLRLPKGVRQYWSPFFQKWITKQTNTRQPLTSPFRKASTETFKNVQMLIRQVSAEDNIAATEMSKNTPFLTRDLLMKAAYGNLLSVRDETGLHWYGVRPLNADIQQLLNSITVQDNVLLARVEGYWVALLPGDPSTVLTMDPISGHPQWLPAQGGGGGNSQVNFYAAPFDLWNGTNFGAGNFGALPLIMPATAEIKSIKFWATSNVPSAVVRPGIYAESGGQMAALLRDGPAVTGVTQGENKLPLASSIVLQAGTPVYIGIEVETANILLGQGQNPIAFWANTGALPPTAPSGSYFYLNAWGAIYASTDA